jgi:Xaa-Pro aminopeptidase
MARDVERIERIQAGLQEARLDALICTLPANVLLVSGYWPVLGSSIAIATRDGRIALLVPPDERELAESGGADEVVEFEAPSLDVLRSIFDAVRAPFHELFRRLGLHDGVVGCETGELVEPASYSAMHLYGSAILELLTDAFKSGSLAPADELLVRLKSVKTPIELDRIRRACRIADCAYELGARQLRPGLKETEAAMLFHGPLQTVGTGFEGVARADGFVFCMSGANAGRAYGAHARSRARVLRLADLALVNCNSYADGYWTGITRTFALGKPDARQQRLYDAVFAARAAALAAAQVGARAADVDRAAREALAERGLGHQFKHPTGHGVGFAAIDHQARPRLHPKSNDRLEAGAVFTIEPGVYIEGYGGLRHSDMVALTESGAELLTPFQSQMEELVV